MSHCYSIIYQRTPCKKVLSSRNHHHTNLRVVLKITLVFNCVAEFSEGCFLLSLLSALFQSQA